MDTRDVDIFVAAHRNSPPTLPLREELVQAGIECVYHPKDNDKANDSTLELNRKRFMVKQLLQSVQERSDMVGATLEHDSFDNSTANSTLTNADANGDDSLRLKNMAPWQPQVMKDGPVGDDDAGERSDFNVPPLLPALYGSDDMDDMTTDFNLPPPGSKEAFKPPLVIFTQKREEDEVDGWWNEENSVLNTTGIGVMEELYKSDTMDDGVGNKEDTLIEKEIIIQPGNDEDPSHYTDDMCTLIDSKCGYYCRNPDIAVTNSHDLALEIENDDDMKLVKHRVTTEVTIFSVDNDGYRDLMDRTNILPRKFPLDSKHLQTTQIPTCSQVDYLFHILNDSRVKPEHVKNILDITPETVRIAREGDKKLALHILCDRQFISRGLTSNLRDNKSMCQMDRQSRLVQEESLAVHTIITKLIEEIINTRVMLKVVAWSNIDACCTSDKNGDLPVHLLARHLQKWTSDIQLFIRGHVMDVSDLARISTISKIISECIDIVLRPVALSDNCLITRGSIGTMLPIHISIIFSSSFDTFHLLLEKASSGASVSYISNNTLTPQHMLPLEILEKLRYDQEQYKTMMIDGNAEFTTSYQWQSSIPDNFCAQDFTRRTDLLFSVHPDILPYRRDHMRLKRIESLIRSEVIRSGDSLSAEVKNIWAWMCTYHDERNIHDNYTQHVRCIVNNLTTVRLGKLINIITKSGKPLLEEATTSVKEILSQRSERTAENQTSAHYRSEDDLGTSKKREHIWNSVTHLPCLATICNSIFNVKEDSIPTSFVIFPFRLQSTKNSSRIFVSESETALATQYTKILSTSASCDSLLTSLDCKYKKKEYLRDDDSFENTDGMAAIFDIFCGKIGYLYFLDEETGIPVTKIVDDTKNIEYPIPINDPISIIKKLLPLMTKGIALMQRLSIVVVFAQVISKNIIEKYPHSWTLAAQLITELLYKEPAESPSSTRSITSVSQKAEVVREMFLHLMSENYNTDEVRYGDDFEWVEELSIMKHLMKKSNLSASHVQQGLGLERIKINAGGYIWVQKQMRNGGHDKRQGPYARIDTISNNEDRGRRRVTFNSNSNSNRNHMSLNSPENIHYKYSVKDPNTSPALKKRYDVDQRIAAINEFLDMNDVEDSGLCGADAYGQNDSTDTFDASNSFNSSRLQGNDKGDGSSTSRGNTTKTYPSKATSTTESTSITNLLEQKKMILRIRNAQLAKYDKALYTLAASNSDLTISAIEEAVRKLKDQIASYERKISTNDISYGGELEKGLTGTVVADIALLERNIARKEAKIESMKKAVQKQEADLLSERLEI